MTARGVLSVVAVEWSKLLVQVKTRVGLAACVVTPFAFAVAMRVQSTVPSDTLFGRAVTESGFATPLVLLGFAGLWVLPALASLVGGDLFAAEDRYGSWSTLLTRSRTRTEIFAGKVVTAAAWSTLAVTILGASSVAAGAIIIGTDPLIDLSGRLVTAPAALTRVAFAWASVVVPSLGFTAIAVLLSVATRSSIAGIGLPVVASLIMQLYAFVDGPDLPRRLLLTSSFNAWHGLLVEPASYGPLVQATSVSVVYVVIAVTIAHEIFIRRNVTS